MQLDPSTLALLQSFYTEKTQLEEEFEQLQRKAQARLDDAQAVDEEDRQRISVEQFRRLFQEDWQMSQFW